MLVEFSVENFRSIKERITLSLIAAPLKSRDPQLDRDALITVNEKLSLLRSAVVYGANASGKSNLIKALAVMRRFVADSARESQEEDPIPVEPFVLNREAAGKPSSFEAVFLLDGVQHRYGFSATQERVVAEWLYYTPTSREVELFTRDEKGIYVRPQFKEGRGVQARTRDKVLFLSAVEGWNGARAKRIRSWFLNDCGVVTGLRDEGYLPFTLKCLQQESYARQIEDLVRRLDLGIAGLSVAEVPLPPAVIRIQDRLLQTLLAEGSSGDPSRESGAPPRTSLELHTRHAVRDAGGKVVGELEAPARQMESDGTLKLVALAGPLLEVLRNGWVLFVDEIDARQHPLITAAILQLFNSPETNPNNAQLICATHDTNLLDRHRLRRDQIYFVEKDATEATHLYSLAEFKLETVEGAPRTIRNDTSLERNYINGLFGGIPYIGDLNRLFVEELQRESPERERLAAGTQV